MLWFAQYFGSNLDVKSCQNPSVLDGPAKVPRKVIFHVQKKYCKSCHATFSNYSNRFTKKSLWEPVIKAILDKISENEKLNQQVIAQKLLA